MGCWTNLLQFWGLLTVYWAFGHGCLLNMPKTLPNPVDPAKRLQMARRWGADRPHGTERNGTERNGTERI